MNTSMMVRQRKPLQGSPNQRQTNPNNTTLPLSTTIDNESLTADTTTKPATNIYITKYKKSLKEKIKSLLHLVQSNLHAQILLSLLLSIIIIAIIFLCTHKPKVKWIEQIDWTKDPIVNSTTLLFAYASQLLSGKGAECTCVDCDDDIECGGLWSGRATKIITDGNNDYHGPKSNDGKRISVVLSYCDRDLSWLPDYLQGFDVDKITIISKCGKDPREEKEGMHLLPSTVGVDVVTLPNVGRCDHSYAYYMTHIMDDNYLANHRHNSDDNHHVTIFLKDSRYVHQDGKWNTLNTIYNSTLQHGWGCGLTTHHNMSVYHYTPILSQFKIKKHRGYHGKTFASKYANMKDWWADMDILQHANNDDVRIMNDKNGKYEPFIPVCYGGVFAIQTSRIKQREHVLQKIQQSLERDDNIEEGHFAERTWAALFATPLEPNRIFVLKNYTNEVIVKCCYNGALYKNDSLVLEGKKGMKTIQ